MNHYKFMPMRFRHAESEYEPQLSAPELAMHRNHLYQDTVDKLNIVVEGCDALHALSETELLLCRRLPAAVAEDIRYYAASYLAHNMFFSSIIPRGEQSGIPFESALCRELRRKYCGLENFAYEIKCEAERIRASGFIWCTADTLGNLELSALADYGVPDLSRRQVLFAYDLWEHSYFSRYGKCRERYIDAIINLTNFAFLAKRYENIIDKRK